MARFKFAKILIIESIPVGQFASGKSLYEMIEPQLKHYERPITCKYVSVESRKEFRKAIEKAGKEAREEGRIPLLHIECHGNDDGLELTNGDRIEWPLLRQLLYPLNRMTMLNMFVCISACWGAYLLKEFVPTEPAPFFGLLSATEEQGPEELFRGFLFFYSTLLETLDGDKAEAAAKEAAPNFYLTDALGHFIKVIRLFRQTHCTNEQYWEKAEKARQSDLRVNGRAASIYFYHSVLKERELPQLQQLMRTFFMLDQFPENVDRFPVTLVDLGR
jgi:hypothetical protein